MQPRIQKQHHLTKYGSQGTSL